MREGEGGRGKRRELDGRDGFYGQEERLPDRRRKGRKAETELSATSHWEGGGHYSSCITAEGGSNAGKAGRSWLPDTDGTRKQIPFGVPLHRKKILN